MFYFIFVLGLKIIIRQTSYAVAKIMAGLKEVALG